MKKTKNIRIKGLIILFSILACQIAKSQTYEKKVTCEHINRTTESSYFTSTDIRNAFVYTYNDMTLYMLYTNNWVYHWTNGVKDAPIHITKPFYYFFNKNSDTIYEFSDSLKYMQIFPAIKLDSLITNNSIGSTIYKPGYSNTLHYKIERVKKRRKRTFLIINDIHNKSKISKDNYIKVYLSKRKMYLHHQIAPDLDSIYGMRTYRVVLHHKSHKLEEINKVKVFSFATISLTNKKYKMSSDRKAEIIDLFDSCLVKSGKPADAIRNWFPKVFADVGVLHQHL